jgi:molybdopterin-containing oxidoreductase family iron-sulfur binding subunit
LSKNEFPEDLPVDEFLGDKESLEDASTTRRDFLKFLGFGVAAASLAACETPVTKAIPYLNKPEEITPGKANYYASTYYDGLDYASILVKTREGRPIFIKGNTSSSLTKGEVNARVNSSVLSLYDGNRLKAPMIAGEETTWASIDNRLGKELEAIKAKGGNVRILTNSIISPSTKRVIDNFTAQFVGETAVENVSSHVNMDSISYAGVLDANEASFSKRVVPTYNFQFAKTILAVGADFLSGWLDAIQYNVGYAETRNPDKDWMSKHFQFEANMSLTGTNADVRVPMKPSEYGTLIAAVYNEIAAKLGKTKVKAGKLDGKYDVRVKQVVDHLMKSKGESIVVCGLNDKNIQLLVNELNWMLGNYEKTIDINKPSFTKQADDRKINTLVKEMNAGKVDALFILGVDPVFTMGDTFKAALLKVKTTVSFATKTNDTSALCRYVCPDNHFLESWNDANPVAGHYSLIQPTIPPLFETRQSQDSFLTWSGEKMDYHNYIKKNWEEMIFTQ